MKIVPQSSDTHIFSTRYLVTCKIYTGYHGVCEVELDLSACTVDNPLAKARGLSLRTDVQTMLYLLFIMPPSTKCEANIVGNAHKSSATSHYSTKHDGRWECNSERVCVMESC